MRFKNDFTLASIDSKTILKVLGNSESLRVFEENGNIRIFSYVSGLNTRHANKFKNECYVDVNSDYGYGIFKLTDVNLFIENIE
jgi:hypothetical protein